MNGMVEMVETEYAKEFSSQYNGSYLLSVQHWVNVSYSMYSYRVTVKVPDMGMDNWSYGTYSKCPCNVAWKYVWARVIHPVPCNIVVV